ncbi:hypothetical protein Rhopal_003992-T1 [Rhodotorula paludigena]|uniref:Uncharacterized protein n=1 Tax=Rhodotorula paludigena TaxID=86838 RepID=A0AAV5GLA0_9BASI|nr:hypothetical protein Rhopal_003992-T1 [Rhodotorula paludigena]
MTLNTGAHGLPGIVLLCASSLKTPRPTQQLTQRQALNPRTWLGLQAMPRDGGGQQEEERAGKQVEGGAGTGLGAGGSEGKDGHNKHIKSEAEIAPTPAPAQQGDLENGNNGQDDKKKDPKVDPIVFQHPTPWAPLNLEATNPILGSTATDAPLQVSPRKRGQGPVAGESSIGTDDPGMAQLQHQSDNQEALKMVKRARSELLRKRADLRAVKSGPALPFKPPHIRGRAPLRGMRPFTTGVQQFFKSTKAAAADSRIAGQPMQKLSKMHKLAVGGGKDKIEDPAQEIGNDAAYWGGIVPPQPELPARSTICERHDAQCSRRSQEVGATLAGIEERGESKAQNLSTGA